MNVPILSPCYKNDYIFSIFPLWIKETTRYLYRGVFLSSFFYLILRIFRDKKINIPLLGVLLYVGIFILVYSVAIPKFHHPRHSVPLYPFIFAIIGIAVGLFLEDRLNIFLKMTGIGIFSIIVMTSLIDNFNHVSFKYISNPFEFKGYEYGYLLKWPLVTENCMDDLDKYIAFKKRNNQKLRPLMNYFPYKYQEKYQEEFGGRTDLHWNKIAVFFIRNHLVEILNKKLRKGYPYIDNWGWAIGIIYRWDIEKCVNFIKNLRFTRTDDVQIVYYSLGLGIGSLDRKRKNECIKELSKLDKNIQESIFKGINDFK